jgi:hypothetical protein
MISAFLPGFMLASAAYDVYLCNKAGGLTPGFVSKEDIKKNAVASF